MNCFKIKEDHLQDLLLKIEQAFHETDKEKQYKAMLVCDEIFTNQIKHGNFKDKEADIEFCFDFEKEDIIMVFRDNAHPFNPLKKEQPDLLSDLDDTALGGLGIFLVKQYTKSMLYSYTDGYNILEVRI